MRLLFQGSWAIRRIGLRDYRLLFVIPEGLLGPQIFTLEITDRFDWRNPEPTLLMADFNLHTLRR